MRVRNLSPYRFLGLWRNPFGELTPQERAELAAVDTEPFLQLLTDSRNLIQFLGGCGYGKTTHLLAVRRAFLQQVAMQRTDCGQYISSPREESHRYPVLYFPERGPRPALLRTRPLFVDEAQRMSWWQKQKLLRGDGPLVITSHRDFSKEFRRRGWSVTTVDVQQPKSAAQIASMLNRRIDASRINDHQPAVTEEFCQRLQECFGYNMRIIEEQLYDSIQSCVRENRAWPPVI